MTMPPRPSCVQTFRTNTLWKAPKNVHGASSLWIKDFVSVAFAQIFDTFKLLEKNHFKYERAPRTNNFPDKYGIKLGIFTLSSHLLFGFPNTEDTMRSFFALSILVLALAASSAYAKRTVIALFKESKYGKFPHILSFPVQKVFSLSS